MERCSGWKALIKGRNKTNNDFREIEVTCFWGNIPQTAVNQNDDLTDSLHVLHLHAADSPVEAPS